MKGRPLRWMAFIGLMLLFAVHLWQAFSYRILPTPVLIGACVAAAIVAILMLIDLFRPNRTALIKRPKL